jgi:hypothetical protein
LAWRQHIVSLLISPPDESNAAGRRGAEEIATACMAQLLGTGLLLSSTDHAESPFAPAREQAAARAIAALTDLVKRVS